MFFNRYVLALIISSLVSLVSIYLVLTKIDPFDDEQLALSLFFISLFFSVSTIISLIGYLIRIFFYQNELLLNHFNVSLRQGVILGTCICAIFGFQMLRTLTWWDSLIIIIISFLVEIYFVAKE